MSRSIDVSAVLTNRSLLSQKHRDIFIKPYLTSEARKAETILLKQRRELITSGISSKTIKLRDDSLFINGRKHGTVIDSSYQTYPLLSDYVSDPPAPVSPNLSPGTCTSSTQQNISRSTSSSVLINTSVSQAINTSTDSSNIPQPVSVQIDTPIPDPINTSPLISNPADLTNRWLQAPNPSSNSIHLFYWNCRSISNKLPFFQSFIYSSTIHIFALSETWLSDKIYSKEILPSGYNIYRSDRHTRGGGVLGNRWPILLHYLLDLIAVPLCFHWHGSLFPKLLYALPLSHFAAHTIPPKACSPDYFWHLVSVQTPTMIISSSTEGNTVPSLIPRIFIPPTFWLCIWS